VSVPGLQARQLHAPNGRLQPVEPAVAALDIIGVLHFQLAARGDHPRPGRKTGAGGDQPADIAEV